MKYSDISCPLCGNINSLFLVVILREAKIIGCRICTNAWTDPPPDDTIYETGDFHGQFKYRNLDDLPSQWKKGIFKQIKVIKQKILAGGKILEIGCGQGWLLEELKNAGFNVVGIEPSVTGSIIAAQKGLNIINDKFPSATLKNEKYDLIILSQVLEHIKEPELFINNVISLLSIRGRVLFVQTNWRGLMPRLFKSSWYAWVPQQHYWHFTPKGLTYIFDKKIFSVENIEYYSLEHGNHILSLVTNIIPNQGDQFHLLARSVI